MEQKIQLKHPAGKKAIKIDKRKYDVMKKSLLKSLKQKGELTHSELLQEINKDFKNNKVQFSGSIAWHLEWVKLSLEADREIERVPESTPQKLRIAN